MLNPLETVVQLGVQLTRAADGGTNITLLYTDADRYFASERLASFTVPNLEVRGGEEGGNALDA